VTAAGDGAGAAAVPSTIRRGALIAVAVLALVNLLNYAHRNVLQPVYDDLRLRYDFTNPELGFIGSAYMFAHAAVTLPMGWIGDRADRRRVIAAGIGLASIAAVLATFATGIVTFTIARVLTGLGTAAVVPVANSILGEAFAGKSKATAFAVFNLGLFLGGVFGFGIGQALGFPTAFLVFAAPGAVLAVAVWRLPVPARRVASADGADLAEGPRVFLTQARALLRIPALPWIIASATAMAFAAGGYLAWLLDFMQTRMSHDDAIQLLGVSMVGGLAGVVVGGRVADALLRRWRHGRLIAIAIGMAMTAPCALVCIYSQPGPMLYVGSILTLFFVSWYHGPIAASVDDLAPPARAATAQSLIIFIMHLVGTAPSAWIMGAVIGTGGHATETAMLVPTAMVVIAALLMVRAATVLARSTGEPGPRTL
jgi:MFS family permease